MPWVGFEPTILAFERAKTVHGLDRAATVNGSRFKLMSNTLKTVLSIFYISVFGLFCLQFVVWGHFWKFASCELRQATDWLIMKIQEWNYRFLDQLYFSHEYWYLHHKNFPFCQTVTEKTSFTSSVTFQEGLWTRKPACHPCTYMHAPFLAHWTPLLITNKLCKLTHCSFKECIFTLRPWKPTVFLIYWLIFWEHQ
jgi:hypothetical protein